MKYEHNKILVVQCVINVLHEYLSRTLDLHKSDKLFISL